MRALIDADIYAYLCGFATQKNVFFTEESEVVAEPVENALSLCKSSLTEIFGSVNSWLAESGESVSHLELFLTGVGNFRDKLATIRPYKGNRKDRPKPVHYAALRNYMVDVWSAKVVDGMEADDAVTIEACKEGFDPDRVVIVSVDKDLRTVPGLLYNFRKREAEIITEQEALVNFYRQCITGDTADAVIGCYRAGEKAAQELITEDLDEVQMWRRVCDAFIDSTEHKKCPYTDPYDAAVETAQLLWLLRAPGAIWQPPTHA